MSGVGIDPHGERVLLQCSGSRAPPGNHDVVPKHKVRNLRDPSPLFLAGNRLEALPGHRRPPVDRPGIRRGSRISRRSGGGGAHRATATDRPGIFDFFFPAPGSTKSRDDPDTLQTTGRPGRGLHGGAGRLRDEEVDDPLAQTILAKAEGIRFPGRTRRRGRAIGRGVRDPQRAGLRCRSAPGRIDRLRPPTEVVCRPRR